MKKFLVLGLVFAMLITLVACGSPVEDPSTTTLPNEEVTTLPDVTADPVGDVTEATTEPVVTDPTVTDAPVTNAPETDAPAVSDEFNVTDMENTTMYATDDLNIRKGPGSNYEKLGQFKAGDAVTVTGRAGTWYRVEFNGAVGFVSASYLEEKAPEVNDDEPTVDPDDNDGEVVDVEDEVVDVDEEDIGIDTDVTIDDFFEDLTGGSTDGADDIEVVE